MNGLDAWLSTADADWVNSWSDEASCDLMVGPSGNFCKKLRMKAFAFLDKGHSLDWYLGLLKLHLKAHCGCAGRNLTRNLHLS